MPARCARNCDPNDPTPLDPKTVGKLVGVNADAEEVTCILALGRYPADEAAYTGGHPQWRHDEAVLIQHL